MVNTTGSVNMTGLESGMGARVIANTPGVPPSRVPPTDARAPAYTVEHTKTGIPVTLIWVPYVVFSVILIGLMLTSFYRFHRKHGHKYRRRRAEVFRQLNVTDIFNQFQNQATGASLPPNGGVNMRVPIETPTPSYSKPPPPAPQPGSSHQDSYYIHPASHGGARGAHGDHGYYGNRGSDYRGGEYHGYRDRDSDYHGHRSSDNHGNRDREYYGNRDYHGNRGGGGDYHSNPRGGEYHGNPRSRDGYRDNDYHGNRSSDYRQGSRSKSSNKASTSGGASSSKRHRRPLVFTSNLNGSMVDVRCGETDSLKTFRAHPPPEASEPTSIWTLPYKKSTLLRPPYSGRYRADSLEDDEVFLLHQTKL